MATTARSVVERQLSEFVGDYRSLTSTSAGVAGGTTIVDTELANLTEDDDGIQGWVRATSGTNDTEVRRILSTSGYTASTTTITVNFKFTNQFASGVTYTLHRVDPQFKFNAIDRAIESLFPDLYIKLRDETLVVDNLLLNQDFETFSGGAFTSWVSIGTPSVTGASSRVIHGLQSASVTATGAVEGIEQNLFFTNVSELVGRTLRFAGWIWASAANAARLRVTFDGTTFTNGAFHAGDEEWEPPGLTFVDAAVPAGATEMTVSCEVADGNEVFFDAMHAYVGPSITQYTLPTSVRTLLSVQVQDILNQPNGNYFDLSENIGVSSGYFLRLIGQNTLTLPTADTATIEIDGNQVDLLVARAAKHLSDGEWARTRDPFWKEIQQNAIDEENRLGSDARMPRLAASKRFRWSQQADGSSKFLILER